MKSLSVYTNSQEINVKLYDTVIVRLTARDTVILSFGEFKTVTTFKHINKVLAQNLIPLTVYTLAGQAYVLNTENGVKYPFYNGIEFDKQGSHLI